MPYFVVASDGAAAEGALSGAEVVLDAVDLA
jgi:hypothetical protein